MKTKTYFIPLLLSVACGTTEITSETKTKEQDIRYWTNPDSDIQPKYVHHVDELVKSSASTKKKGDGPDDYTLEYLDSKTLKLLNAHELLYYCLAYPCSYTQNCSAIDRGGDSTKPQIARYLPDQFNSHNTSNLQNNFLERNRDSVISLLNKIIEKHPEKTDVAYLCIVRNLNAIECIPAIIKTASGKNTCNYTALVNLLTGYREFMATGMYTKLFNDDNVASNVRIDASKENVKRLCDLAMKMYNEQRIQ